METHLATNKASTHCGVLNLTTFLISYMETLGRKYSSPLK